MTPIDKVALSARRERLARAFDLKKPDRPPILGGWLAAPEHVQALTGCTDEEYWADPARWARRAERALESDGAVDVFVPVQQGGYRCVDQHVMDARAAYTMESVVAEIESQPGPDEVRESFDEESAYAAFASELRGQQEGFGEVVWCPADWDMNPIALWYSRFGYENALLLPALHPETHLKLMRASAERARQRATLQARAIREGLRPAAILFGEDLCGRNGPMISPDFLRREYYPLLEYAMEPLRAASARAVWHCDGDVRPILNDLLACGISGLQGFQRECGMELEWIVKRRTRGGDALLIFGPLSVTTTLPHGTPDDVPPRSPQCDRGLSGRTHRLSSSRATRSHPTCRWQMSTRSGTRSTPAAGRRRASPAGAPLLTRRTIRPLLPAPAAAQRRDSSRSRTRASRAPSLS